MNSNSDFAISARGLGKKYLVPSSQYDAEYETLSDKLAGLLKVPLRWFDKQPTKQAKDWFWALQELDFDIQHGEIVGIVGRNGNGKSTLLKILSRITSPTTGYADLQGRVCSLLEVGTGFHPELSGAENIFLNGSILGMTRREIQKKFDAIVAFSEVEKFLNMPVKRYSSGMRVRLAFSVAAYLDPDILIIDEVLAVGDLAFQKKCLQRMNEVARSGRTILFVSHNMPAIESLCQRTIWLMHGRIHMDGATSKVVPKFVQAMTHSGGAENGAEVDLENHPHRVAHSRPIMKKLRLKSIQGDPSSLFGVGEGMQIELSYDACDAPSGMGFNIRIYHENGQPLMQLHSRIQSKLVISRNQSGTVRCNISSMPLLPGEYSVDVEVGTWSEPMDRIESAARFRIEARDFYGTGELPNSTDGSFVLPAEWSEVSTISAASHIGTAVGSTESWIAQS